MRKTIGVTMAATVLPLFVAQGATMDLKTQAFKPGGMIPAKYTCDGPDLSPPLTWSDPPPKTASFALILDDPDAPMGTWVHWVMWNIPATARSLDENVPKAAALPNGARQGTNDFSRVGYGGPCPPSGTHRYVFTLYALDTTLNLPSETTKALLEDTMRGHILGQGKLIGTYGR